MSTNPIIQSAIDALLNTLKKNPEIWDIRKEAAQLLFDNSSYTEAANLIWDAPQIPSEDLEIAFAARILSRAKPHRAIRLLNHVLDSQTKNPAKLLALANSLMHYGMVMQAARFYGAATACGENLSNSDLEHFLLWLDDSHRLWGDWKKDDQTMSELPWVKRDQDQGQDFEKMMAGLTTPIVVPGLKKNNTAEHIVNDYYRQLPVKDSQVTAPPAVTVPLDQINPDHIVHNTQMGAAPTPTKMTSSEPNDNVPLIAPKSDPPASTEKPKFVFEDTESQKKDPFKFGL